MKIILVAVGLVFAPMQVCAECAWVLWNSVQTQPLALGLASKEPA
jgi:hypothetical protein